MKLIINKYCFLTKIIETDEYLLHIDPHMVHKLRHSAVRLGSLGLHLESFFELLCF